MEVARVWSSWHEMLEERARIRKAIRRGLFGGELGKAWNQWEWMLRERQRMRKFGCRLLNQAVSRAWEGWQELLAERARLQKFLR